MDNSPSNLKRLQRPLTASFLIAATWCLIQTFVALCDHRQDKSRLYTRTVPSKTVIRGQPSWKAIAPSFMGPFGSLGTEHPPHHVALGSPRVSVTNVAQGQRGVGETNTVVEPGSRWKWIFFMPFWLFWVSRRRRSHQLHPLTKVALLSTTGEVTSGDCDEGAARTGASEADTTFGTKPQEVQTQQDQREQRSSSREPRIDQREQRSSSREPRIFCTGRPFPLSLILGYDAVRTSLLLATINPRMGGVIMSGGHGTAKSVMARGLQRIMPPIERVKGSLYNIDPSRPDQVDDFLQRQLEERGQQLGDLETEVVEAPFIQVPLNVIEDRLLGSVNVEDSVKQGRTVFEPGLLSRAHRGILCIDDINLLDDELCNTLLSALADGWVRVEREGISMKYPCDVIMVATFNPAEGLVRDHILDRMAVALSVDAMPLSVEERAEAVHRVIQWSDMSREELLQFEEEEDMLRARIVLAREYCRTECRISPKQIHYLCEESTRFQCMGQRAEIFATEAAKALASWECREVNANDLKLAVKLVIAPRGMVLPPMEAPPPPPPTPEMQDEGGEEDTEEQEDEPDQQVPSAVSAGACACVFPVWQSPSRTIAAQKERREVQGRQRGK